MRDARARYRQVLEHYRLNPTEPGSDTIWSPELETASRSRIQEIQSDKLVAAVAFLYESSAHFQAKFRAAGLVPADIRSLDDLHRIPVTTKQSFVDDAALHPPWGTYSPISQQDWTRDGWTLFTTGGTTAAPRPFRMTRFDREMAAWIFARGFYAMGVRPGDVGTFITNYGAHIFFWEAHQGLNHMGVPVIALGGADLKRRIDFQRVFPASVLGATASFLLFLGEQMKRAGLDPKSSGVKFLFSGAEPGACIPSTKARVEAMWGAELHEWFGATEVGPSAHSCAFEVKQRQRAMNLHFLEDSYIVEVVDPKTYEPVPEGSDGVLVMSGLSSEGTPFPRYLLGDYTRLTTEKCGCGRTTARAVGGMSGRMDDMLTIRGIHVYPSAIEDVVRRVVGITEAYEIVVERRDGQDAVTVRCEPDPAHAKEQWPEIAAAVQRDVASALEVKVTVEACAYGTLSREFKAKRIRDLR